MDTDRPHDQRRTVIAARVAVCLAVAASGFGYPSVGRAQQAPPIGPVRTERFPAAAAPRFRAGLGPVDIEASLAGTSATPFSERPEAGPNAPFAGAPRELPATIAAGSAGSGRTAPGSDWVVAGAALLGGALGWVVGAGGTLLATRDRLAQDDLSPLLYAAIGGVAVSVPAGAVLAHRASAGHGSVLASTLIGYAIAGAALAAWPDGGWLLGPALAVPLTTAVETF